jgi:hypothetical protein
MVNSQEIDNPIPHNRFHHLTYNTCGTCRTVVTGVTSVTFLNRGVTWASFQSAVKVLSIKVFRKNNVKGPVRTVANSLSNLLWKPSDPDDLFGLRVTRRLETSSSCISKLVYFEFTGRSSIAGILFKSLSVKTLLKKWFKIGRLQGCMQLLLKIS